MRSELGQILRLAPATRGRILAAVLFPLAMLVAACGPADNEPGPGGVSVGEARALEEAAEIIEERRFPLPGETEQAEGKSDGGEQVPSGEKTSPPSRQENSR